MEQAIIDQLILMEGADATRFEGLLLHLNNISAGLQIIITVVVAFLVWQVLKVFYKLFGGIFLGV